MTDTERGIVRQVVNGHYDREVVIQDVKTGIRLHVDDRALTPCPGFYWNEHGGHFVLSKTGDSRYRSLFFCRFRDHFGSGREEYDDIGDCAIMLLKMQADEEVQRLAGSKMSGRR